MFLPVKNRLIHNQLKSFFINLQVEGNIHVPFLCDGSFEVMLAVNNSLDCYPINRIFNNLWEFLLQKPRTLSMMIQKCDNESSGSEALLNHKNKLVAASNLINLCRRSKDKVLFNSDLKPKNLAFNTNYYDNLNKFKTNIKLVKKRNDCLVFQDLSYLNDDQKKTLLPLNDCLLVSNNYEDVELFNNLNHEQFNNYYLLWSKK